MLFGDLARPLADRRRSLRLPCAQRRLPKQARLPEDTTKVRDRRLVRQEIAPGTNVGNSLQRLRGVPELKAGHEPLRVVNNLLIDHQLLATEDLIQADAAGGIETGRTGHGSCQDAGHAFSRRLGIRSLCSGEP